MLLCDRLVRGVPASSSVHTGGETRTHRASSQSVTAPNARAGRAQQGPQNAPHRPLHILTLREECATQSYCSETGPPSCPSVTSQGPRANPTFPCSVALVAYRKQRTEENAALRTAQRPLHRRPARRGARLGRTGRRRPARQLCQTCIDVLCAYRILPRCPVQGRHDHFCALPVRERRGRLLRRGQATTQGFAGRHGRSPVVEQSDLRLRGGSGSSADAKLVVARLLVGGTGGRMRRSEERVLSAGSGFSVSSGLQPVSGSGLCHRAPPACHDCAAGPLAMSVK